MHDKGHQVLVKIDPKKITKYISSYVSLKNQVWMAFLCFCFL